MMVRTLQHTGLPAVVMALLVVAGCGSGSTNAEKSGADGAATSGSDQGGSLPDPCTLLTAAEIEAATGVSFGQGAPSDIVTGKGRTACDWKSSGKEFATAQVLILDGGGSVFDLQRSSAKQLGVEDADVPGASRAYATTEGSIVAMEVGDLFVQVAYIPSGPGAVLDKTSQLAATVAARVS